MHPNQRAATQQRVLEEAARIDTGGFFKWGGRLAPPALHLV